MNDHFRKIIAGKRELPYHARVWNINATAEDEKNLRAERIKAAVNDPVYQQQLISIEKCYSPRESLDEWFKGYNIVFMTPTYLEICKYIVGIGEFPKEAIIYAEVYQDSRPWREITTNGLKEHRTSLDDFESELAILAGDFSKVKKEDYFEIYETLCEYFPTQEVINVISKLPDVDFNRFTYSALRHYRIDLIDECVRRGINYTGDLDPNFLFKFCFLSKDNIPRAYFDSYMSNFYSGYPSYPTEETLFRD